MARVSTARLTDVPPDIAAMYATHLLALTIGAPDLAEDPHAKSRPSGTVSESVLTRRQAIARAQILRDRAHRSLARRPVAGYPAAFIRCGHEKTPETTYLDAKGPRCRLCRNARRRDARSLDRARMTPEAA